MLGATTSVLFYFVNPCDGYVYALGRLITPITVDGIELTDIFTPVRSSSVALANIEDYILITGTDNANDFHLLRNNRRVNLAFTRQGSDSYHTGEFFGPKSVSLHRSYVYGLGTDNRYIDGVFILPAAGNMETFNTGELCVPASIGSAVQFKRFPTPIRFGLAAIQSLIRTTFNDIIRDFAVCTNCGSGPEPPEPIPPDPLDPELEPLDPELDPIIPQPEPIVPVDCRKKRADLDYVLYILSALTIVVIFIVIVWMFTRE